MSAAGEPFHYFIKESQTYDPRQLAAEIATFFAKQKKNVVIMMRGPKISTVEASTNFKTLVRADHQYIKFMYCKEYKVVMNKLLELDSGSFVPQVVIVQSLHQWYNAKTKLKKVPSIYTAVCSAAIDVINHLAISTKQNCFSFITTDADEFPTSVTGLLYEMQNVVEAKPDFLRDLLKQHEELFDLSE